MSVNQAIHGHATATQSLHSQHEGLNVRNVLLAIIIAFALPTLFSLYGVSWSKAQMRSLPGTYSSIQAHADDAAQQR